jgi:hypothetical protein
VIANGHEIGVFPFLFQATANLTDVLALGRFDGEETALGFDDETLEVLLQSTLSLATCDLGPLATGYTVHKT